MKIIDAPVPKSKSAQMRDVIKQIAGKNKAVSIASQSELREFYRMTRSLGLSGKSKKRVEGGWLFWVY